MALPWIVWMKKKYLFKKNPLPKLAIVKPGSQESSENGSNFNPGAVSSDINNCFDRFVLEPAYGTGGDFGALWSLGEGDEARGYGKSNIGMYMSKGICEDFGHEKLMEMGLTSNEAEKVPLIAAYASFDKNKNNSFNAVAFEHVKWLTDEKNGINNKSPVERIRARLINTKKRKKSDLDHAYRNVKEFRTDVSGTTLGPLLDEFLRHLIYSDNRGIKEYLGEINEWHRTRNGFMYLDTLLTFAATAGIKRVILFTDQVEDFAATGTTRSKRIREVERFRDIIAETSPFNQMVYFILTMHPRAYLAIEDIWLDARLPSLRPEDPGSGMRTVVLEGVKSGDDAVKLFESYLQNKQYRIKEHKNKLHPFTQEAIEYLREVWSGKPGYMLQSGHAILWRGAKENTPVIDRDFSETIIEGEIDTDETTTVKKEKGIKEKLQKGLE